MANPGTPTGSAEPEPSVRWAAGRPAVTPARLPRPGIAGPPEPAGQDEAAALRRLVAMCSHLSALASQAAGLARVVTVLAETTGSGVAAVNRTLEVLACAGVDGPDTITGQLRDDARQSTLRTVLTAAARNRRALAVPGSEPGRPLIVVAPVFVGEDVAGDPLTRSLHDLGFTEDMRLLAIEHGAMVCGIVLGRDLVVTAAAGRARQELVDGLLLSRRRGDPEVQRWARHLGLDPTREHFVMSFEIPDTRPGAGTSPAELLLSRTAPGAVLASRTDEVVAIVPVGAHGATASEQGRRLARACLAGAGQQPRISAVGVGTPSPDAAGIARSYAEARRAVAAGRRMGEAGTITAFADLGIHRLLLRVPEVSDLRSFADEVLGGLTDEQRASGIDYLATLSAYFRENGSPGRAGRQLHVHSNTVSYRIRRIEELTGLSLGAHRDRLMAEVAVEILEGLEERS